MVESLSSSFNSFIQPDRQTTSTSKSIKILSQIFLIFERITQIRAALLAAYRISLLPSKMIHFKKQLSSRQLQLFLQRNNISQYQYFNLFILNGKHNIITNIPTVTMISFVPVWSEKETKKSTLHNFNQPPKTSSFNNQLLDVFCARNFPRYQPSAGVCFLSVSVVLFFHRLSLFLFFGYCLTWLVVWLHVYSRLVPSDYFLFICHDNLPVPSAGPLKTEAGLQTNSSYRFLLVLVDPISGTKSFWWIDGMTRLFFFFFSSLFRMLVSPFLWFSYR